MTAYCALTESTSSSQNCAIFIIIELNNMSTGQAEI